MLKINSYTAKLFKLQTVVFRSINCTFTTRSSSSSRIYQIKLCRPCLFNRQLILKRPLGLVSIISRKYHQLSIKDPSVQNYVKKLLADQDSLHLKNPQLCQVVRRIDEKQVELAELAQLVEENQELKEIAAKDGLMIDEDLKKLEKEFFQHVVEPEPFDHNDVVIEISAGIGGQEAMLFAQELFRMYENYSNYHQLEFTVTKYESTELGGVRQGSATVSGLGAFSKLKFEGGVHRVQRVPKTEKSGRIHTSTATVAVLPLPNEIQVNIRPQDLKFEAKKASGAGGQHVNTTESAIRLTHVPTGTVVECQMERSQIRNRELAIGMLRARIYEKESQNQASHYHTARKLQVGLAGRSEKIRTYNFVQDRVTDHRVGLSLYNLKGILDGGAYLEDLLSKLEEFDQNERMSQLFS